MRVLVTGASGLFGANFLLQQGSRYECLAVCHRHPVREDGWRTVQADLTQRDEVARLVEQARPDAVLHAAAATNVDACEDDPGQARRVNAEAPTHLAAAARAAGIPLIALSTDYVFDGTKPGGRYTEGDPPRPLGVYAATKRAGEEAVLAYPRGAVVRTTLYGWNAQPKQSFAERVLGALAGGHPVTAFTDMYWSPILANDLADAVVRLLERPMPGLFHVAGRERVSRYDFARVVAEEFGHDPAAIRPGRLAEARLKARRPPDASLDVSAFERIVGVRLPDVRAGVRRMRALQQQGLVARLRQLVA